MIQCLDLTLFRIQQLVVAPKVHVVRLDPFLDLSGGLAYAIGSAGLRSQVCHHVSNKRGLNSLKFQLGGDCINVGELRLSVCSAPSVYNDGSATPIFG